MSVHAAFRRQPVPGEMALRHNAITLPAPIRGIVENENWAYTKPGAAIILDNWFPTQRGIRLRGGTERWCTLPAPTEVVRSGFSYVSGAVQRMFAATTTRLFDVTFSDAPALVTGLGTQTNGNYSAAQLANPSGDYLLAVNDAGDYVRRYDGTSWQYLNTAFAGTPSRITGPATAPANVQDGRGLTHIWKYANRLFFVQGGSMNAWCLPVHSVGGELIYIPLSGATKRGGSLLFGASWSVDSGSGMDDKCLFVTDQGEIVVFSGTDPTNAASWRQEGCYDVSRPLGKNGHAKLGGDILIATIDGILPLTATMQKDIAALSLSAITYNIEPMWMRELLAKKVYPWVLSKWDEGNMLLVNFPGGKDRESQTVAVSNVHTGAWGRFTNWDAICFMQLNGSLFFGTQDGRIMLAESSGRDDYRLVATNWLNNTAYAIGAIAKDTVANTYWRCLVAHTSAAAGTFAADRAARPTYWTAALPSETYTGSAYACTMVGGWEMFQVPPNQVTWLQARAAFFSAASEAFEPQLGATTDYQFIVPLPPALAPAVDLVEVWDQGLWDNARWDQPGSIEGLQPIKHTMWVSIGETGFSHAPIVQVTIEQQVKPSVELISLSATYVRLAANV